ncbi:MAG: hypothetical protein KDH94_03110, partial [Coxiellaceae bacterium]|nr:hypothetical protein [Coxiellaceae bacterium]
MRQVTSGTKDGTVIIDFGAKNNEQQFVLGYIPDPSQLNDKEFANEIQRVFYNLIWLHSQHLYAETADKVMASLFKLNLENISQEQRNNLEAWFLDPRFKQVLILLNARTTNPTGELQSYLDWILKKFNPTEQEKGYLFEDVMITHNQAWGSFIGLDLNSILKMLIQIRQNKGEHQHCLQLEAVIAEIEDDETNQRVLEQLKQK